MSDNVNKSVMPVEIKKVMFAKVIESGEASDSGLASANSSVNVSAGPTETPTTEGEHCSKGKVPIIEFRALNPSKEKKQESTFVRSQSNEHKRAMADYSSIKGTINTTVNSDGNVFDLVHTNSLNS